MLDITCAIVLGSTALHHTGRIDCEERIVLREENELKEIGRTVDERRGDIRGARKGNAGKIRKEMKERKSNIDKKCPREVTSIA